MTSKPQPIIASMLASSGTNETTYIPIGSGYQEIRKCGPSENRSFFIQPPAEYNVGGLALSNPMHPPYTDPLYAPYLDKQRVGYYGCNTSGYKHNPAYPVVDPARMKVGRGWRARTQYEGICPPGYVMGPNSMCFQMDEPIGYFYSDQLYWRYPGTGLIHQNTEATKFDDWDPRTW